MGIHQTSAESDEDARTWPSTREESERSKEIKVIPLAICKE
jgi:hypothetical protein